MNNLFPLAPGSSTYQLRGQKGLLSQDTLGDKVVVLLLDGSFELPQAGRTTPVLVWLPPPVLHPYVARRLQLAELHLDEIFQLIKPHFQPAHGLAPSKLRAFLFGHGTVLPGTGLMLSAEVAWIGGGCARSFQADSQFCGLSSEAMARWLLWSAVRAPKGRPRRCMPFRPSGLPFQPGPRSLRCYPSRDPSRARRAAR